MDGDGLVTCSCDPGLNELSRWTEVEPLICLLDGECRLRQRDLAGLCVAEQRSPGEKLGNVTVSDGNLLYD